MKKTADPVFLKRPALWISVLLAAAVFSVYGQVHRYDFVNFDDTDYVTQNAHIQKGITSDSTAWAFSTFYASNWHPVTWLSHMLDYRLFGPNPGPHHLINLLFHLFNTLLLFLVLRQMTGALWQSGFVAALFALHPLHVESVAWISERKDLLCAFFFILALWGYNRYVRHPSGRRYLLVMLLFALALMSKPMAVTLPFVLLLLDFWPLNRIGLGRPSVKNAPTLSTALYYRIREKIPLFLLSAASSIVTFYAQAHGGAVKSLDFIPMSARMANALVAYAGYIVKMIYPFGLAFLYPFPETIPGWKVAGACLLLALIFALAIRNRNRRPYLIVGWLWFLGMLVPVIGIVQVGMQSMADRYSYLPLIGLFIMIAWGVPEIAAKWRRKKTWLAVSAALVLVILAAVAWRQTGYWKNSITLFAHALKVTRNNAAAHYNLGNALAMQGNADQAAGHYREALRIKPGFADAHTNLGNVLGMQGKTDAAIAQYQRALEIEPDYEGARYNLALALDRKGRIDEAVEAYQRVLKANPDHAEAHCKLGIALYKTGDREGAVSAFQNALRINPEHALARKYLKTLLQAKRDKQIVTVPSVLRF
jgi:protein O-mannosyl-transferase